TVEPELGTRLDEARELLGLAVAGHRRVPGRPAAAALLSGDRTVYVVADAFHLPWVPYHGQAHMEHSFLLRPSGSGVVVLDGYHNDTPYGPARPGAWSLSEAEVPDALPDGATVVDFHPTRVPATVVRAGTPPGTDGWTPPVPGRTAAYVRAYREHPDRAAAMERLTLETWLLARARALFAARRAADGHADPAVEAHAADWGKLVEQTYLAHRRLQRGRPEPSGPLDRLHELLDADTRIFAADADVDA
ncbi:hypothetical protein GTW78_17445, partial [Streptomyces sp. SID4948]|uniref:hypothetical protein n=1 Tax=Streptomyces sp. SID4948 TaxID=2690287 RepID=UPI00139B3301